MSDNGTNRRDFIRIAAAGAAALGLGLKGIRGNSCRISGIDMHPKGHQVRKMSWDSHVSHWKR